MKTFDDITKSVTSEWVAFLLSRNMRAAATSPQAMQLITADINQQLHLHSVEMQLDKHFDAPKPGGVVENLGG